MKRDTTRHQQRFLAAFTACGQVRAASQAAKVHRTSHYRWMESDSTYPKRFHEAQQRAAQELEDEAVMRAKDGVRKPVFYRGRIVGYEVVYSDKLLMKLLAANNPVKFGVTSKLATPNRRTFVPLPKFQHLMEPETRPRIWDDTEAARAFMNRAPKESE